MRHQERWIIGISGVFLLVLYHAIFHGFFPNSQGTLGHDYALFLPKLLDGYFWYATNGLLAIPWFTPAFCGGIPVLPDPQSVYYSVPQFLSFMLDPVWSVYLTFLGFAGIGFVGAYVLLRTTFRTSAYTALFAASLFLFNGFYAYRMIIGHLTYHAFMLVPLLAYMLLRHTPERSSTARWQSATDTVLAGGLMAYMFQAGMVNVILPAMVSVAVIGLIHGVIYRRSGQFWLSLSLAGMLAVCLCLAKLTAATAYLQHFGRDTYTLPGAPSIIDIIALVFSSLFIAPAHAMAAKVLVNVQWALDRHEFEFGVTWVPLGIFLMGMVSALRRKSLWRVWQRLDRWQWLQLAILAGCCCLPILLNYYTPAWNALLKQVPILKNSTSLVRWFSLYIPVVVVITALVVDRTPVLRQYQPYVVALGITSLVALNITTNRDYYQTQPYDPREIMQAHQRVRQEEWLPKISHVAVFTDSAGRLTMPVARNDVLARGNSQLLCYEPLFGYRLEAFPVKTLRPGPVMEAHDGVLNLKQPACYVYPEANHCVPGDHFVVSHSQEAEAFVQYQPFAFAMPVWQRAANLLNGIALLGTLAFLPVAIVQSRRQRRNRPTDGRRQHYSGEQPVPAPSLH